MTETTKKRPPTTSFTIGDYFQQALHFGAGALTMAAVGYWAGPLLLAGSAAGVGLFTIATVKFAPKLEKLMPQAFKNAN